MKNMRSTRFILTHTVSLSVCVFDLDPVRYRKRVALTGTRLEQLFL